MTDLVIDGLDFDIRDFAVPELTQAMNVMPNSYNLVTQLGIFGDPIPLSTTIVGIEIQNWTLNLLPATERGGPASKGSTGKREKRWIEIPNVTHEDAVTVAEMQNLRGFGTTAPVMLMDEVNRRLFNMARKHQLTHEWYRIGALKGLVLDSDGSTMIDFFSMFGETEKNVGFTDTQFDDPADAIRNIKRHMEDNLDGDTMTGVAALCSSSFMDWLLTNDDIKQAYDYAANQLTMIGGNPRITDRRYNFVYQDVTFVEYRGKASAIAANGTTSSRAFITEGDARFFPVGTLDTFSSYCAPGDFAEALNMPGQLYYAKAAGGKWNRSLDILTQSNFLPVCRRPKVLVRGHLGNSSN